MKSAFESTHRKTRNWLTVAQLLALTYFALGLAFAWHPAAGILFLFTTVAPVLVSGAVAVLAKEWIGAYQRRQIRHEVVQRTRTRFPVTMAG
jgi:hypothetical protein